MDIASKFILLFYTLDREQKTVLDPENGTCAKFIKYFSSRFRSIWHPSLTSLIVIQKFEKWFVLLFTGIVLLAICYI